VALVLYGEIGGNVEEAQGTVLSGGADKNLARERLENFTQVIGDIDKRSKKKVSGEELYRSISLKAMMRKVGGTQRGHQRSGQGKVSSGKETWGRHKTSRGVGLLRRLSDRDPFESRGERGRPQLGRSLGSF